MDCGQTACRLAILHRAYWMSGENHWAKFDWCSCSANNFADNISDLQDMHGGKTENCLGRGRRPDRLGDASGIIRCGTRVCITCPGKLRQRGWIVSEPSATC